MHALLLNNKFTMILNLSSSFKKSNDIEGTHLLLESVLILEEKGLIKTLSLSLDRSIFKTNQLILSKSQLESILIVQIPVSYDNLTVKENSKQ